MGNVTYSTPSTTKKKMTAADKKAAALKEIADYNKKYGRTAGTSSAPSDAVLAAPVESLTEPKDAKAAAAAGVARQNANATAVSKTVPGAEDLVKKAKKDKGHPTQYYK